MDKFKIKKLRGVIYVVEVNKIKRRSNTRTTGRKNKSASEKILVISTDPLTNSN